MIVYMGEKFRHILKLDFVRFCIVGGTGFVINLILLTIFNKVLNIPIFIAQLLAAEIALFSNFMLHHNWTYKHRRIQKSLASLIVQFHATSWPAILGSSIMVSLGVRVLHFNSILALVIASAIALGWNFGWSKFVVWRNVTPKEIEEIAE